MRRHNPNFECTVVPVRLGIWRQRIVSAPVCLREVELGLEVGGSSARPALNRFHEIRFGFDPVLLLNSLHAELVLTSPLRCCEMEPLRDAAHCHGQYAGGGSVENNERQESTQSAGCDEDPYWSSCPRPQSRPGPPRCAATRKRGRTRGRLASQPTLGRRVQPQVFTRVESGLPVAAQVAVAPR